MHPLCLAHWSESSSALNRHWSIARQCPAPVTPEAVAACLAWLRRPDTQRAPDRPFDRWCRTAELKTHVERWVHDQGFYVYIAEEAFRIAAMSYGLEVRAEIPLITPRPDYRCDIAMNIRHGFPS